ncbi:hypothetical protein Tsubulata_016096 [Turnera subulata]|uniref:DUF4283 domain-containing protein n=1 Tax=Turnera subulata TaxID=218843 RepID=A0A9Q0FH83_9ROSI|nr:hypothetical protein Tsubulata_016096 [Turnera subulata]
MSATYPAASGLRQPVPMATAPSLDVSMTPVEVVPSPPPSFKDKLVADQNLPAGGDGFVEQEGDIVATQTPEGPVIKISDRYRAMLHKRWENTLIVKLWGRSIGFKSLCNKLSNLWNLKAGVHVVDLEHNFYFVRFHNRQDYLHALTNGPWIVFGHYLTVEP